MAKLSDKFKKATKKFEKDIVKRVGKEIPKILEKQVIDTIEKGTSPVLGKGKFKAYSRSYKKQIDEGRYPGKSKTPVNLKLSGDLLKSIFTKIKKSKEGITVTVGFKNKLADIHNRKGAGKKQVIRRMLPTENGEKFRSSITKLFLAKIEEIVDDVVKEFNRKK